MAEQEKGLQETLTKVTQVSKKMGMSINAQKTESQFLGSGDKRIQLSVDGNQLEQVESFVYLGGNISAHGGSDKDVERRIGLARGIWQTLGKIWNSKELSRNTKIRMYETLVLSALMYNSETWTLKEKQKQRLRVFEMACLRKIEGVTRWDRIRNTEIYSRLNLDHDIVERIRSRRLRYFGHLNRMKKDRYPAIAYNGYVQGKRRRGRPRKRWIDTIREDCEEMDMTIQEAIHRTQDRRRWRATISERPMRVTTSPRP